VIWPNGVSGEWTDDDREAAAETVAAADITPTEIVSSRVRGQQMQPKRTSISSARTATVLGDDSAAIQQLFVSVVAKWRAAGIHAVGVISQAHGLPDRTCSAGVLRDIVSGDPYPIFLETLPEGTSCHLDAAGVENACASVLDQWAASDVVVLSKFGKLEAMGEGLAPAFKAAFAVGKPVLTTVSAKHRDAWRAFAPETTFLSADDVTIMMWWQSLRTT
jgi:hypothetical protein